MNGMIDMDTGKVIWLLEQNRQTNKLEETGETVDVYAITRSMTMENFALVFSQFVSYGRKDYRQGRELGLRLRSAHPLLQRSIIGFVFGIITGLSEQYYTEAGNDMAISTARRISQMIDNGHLKF